MSSVLGQPEVPGEHQNVVLQEKVGRIYNIVKGAKEAL